MNRQFTAKPRLADAAKGACALGEALFDLTWSAEKTVAPLAEEGVFASLPQGGVLRATIFATSLKAIIRGWLPRSKSANQAAIARVDTHDPVGIGSAARTRLNVSL